MVRALAGTLQRRKAVSLPVANRVASAENATEVGIATFDCSLPATLRSLPVGRSHVLTTLPIVPMTRRKPSGEMAIDLALPASAGAGALAPLKASHALTPSMFPE